MRSVLVLLLLAVLTPAQQAGVETTVSKTEGKPGLEKHEGKTSKPKPVKKTLYKPVKKSKQAS
jgi:hypothetical protein